jgi:hypothetical protein
MPRLRIDILTTLALVAALPPTLGAQSPSSAPRTTMQVAVSLGDNMEPVHVLKRQRVIVYTPRGDSIVTRTDGYGAVSLTLPVGSYRVTVPDAYAWHGRAWRWSVPVEVAPGMEIVDLNQRNALPEGMLASGGGRDSLGLRPRYDRFMRRDPSMGVVASLFLPGGGQAYASKTVKALVLLGIGGGGMLGGYAYDRHQCEDRTTGTGLLPGTGSQRAVERVCGQKTHVGRTLGAIALGTTWIISIATAAHDVTDWNDRYARIGALDVQVRQLAGGTGIGLSARF